MIAVEGAGGWRRWFTADPSITSIGDRRTIELVSFLVVMMSVVSTVAVVVALFVARAYVMSRLPVLLGFLGLYVVLFAVNRTKHHRIAAIALCAAPLALNLSVGVADAKDPAWYAFVPVSVILAGTLLPLRMAVVIGVLSVAGTAAIVFVHDDYATSHGWLVLTCVTLVCAILLGLARFRSRVESERIAEVERLARQLSATERLESIGQFAGGVAHDFNNLLTVIIASADLVRRGRDVPKFIDAIDDAATRAAALTRQLLAFTRNRASVRTPLIVDDMLRDMDPLLRRLIPENVELVLDLGVSWAIEVDESQLQQVILNLAANARDAMPSGGKLRLSTSEVSPDSVRIAVSDTGFGMDAATRTRAFEPFFTTKPAHVGTGLGLATVAANIQQAGGTVELSSTPGAGTTVTIVIPRTTKVPERAHVPTSTLAGPVRGVALLVEDDPDVRSTTKHILRELGLMVVVAANAGEIPRALKDAPGRLQIVVSDVVMPGKTGLVVVEELRASHPGLAAVLISGYSEDDVAAMAVQPHTRFVAKPFTAAALMAAVSELLTERVVDADAS